MPIVVIATSHQSRSLVVEGSGFFILGDLEQYDRIDCLVDGYDAALLSSGTMIKGGGGAHVVEKIAAIHAAFTIYAGTVEKVSSTASFTVRSIPIEVIPIAASLLRRSLLALDAHPSDGSFQVAIRNCVDGGGKAGPIVTDSGNLIVDWKIPEGHALWENPSLLERHATALTGVVGCGLFVGLADLVVWASDQESFIRAYGRT